MKIQSINSFYNVIPFRTDKKEATTPNFRFNNGLSADVVSFSAKKYDADSITNPTNHCGYCGCKVYTEAQIESIAKEMLSLKSERLQGKIKSVLEKIAGAKHSEEIALAKRLENSEEIDFFNTFLEASEKKSYLKGDAIFEQVYQKNSDEAFELLTLNMRPLLRTVDHISPQNREEENNNSDINLVEACYCCNHDLKKGVSFNEFYTMFPSIKNNMPADKFKYAVSHVLEGGQSGIIQRLSATNVMKSLQRLLIQREEAVNNLNSIDYRISGLMSQIDETIGSIKSEISDKRTQIADLQVQLEELKKDPEFLAMQRREQLENSLSNVKGALTPLRDRRKSVSNQINQVRNPQKDTKKQKGPKVTETEAEQQERMARIAELKKIFENLSANIQLQEDRQLDIEIQLENLNKQHPTLEMLMTEKRKLEAIIYAHADLRREQEILASNTKEKTALEEECSDLEKRIEENPFKGTSFSVDDYSEEEQQKYQRYLDVLNAVNFIEQHPNGGDVNVIIKSAAKQALAEELEELKKQPIVVDYQNSEIKNSLISELAKCKKQKETLSNAINASEKQCRSFAEKAGEMSEEEAQSRLGEVNASIKYINDKQNEIKIPQKIASLEAEISILEQTIKDLEKQKSTVQQ